MRPTAVFVAIAFIAGLAVGFLARGGALGTLFRNNGHAVDLEAIKRLHAADVEATLKQDPAYLDRLWSDDCVRLDVPGPPVVGIKAMKEMYGKFKADYPDFKLLKYTPDYEAAQLAIADGWAIEVGYTEATYQISAKENPVTVPRTLGMRVLKRQSDGSWKFAVVGLQ